MGTLLLGEIESSLLQGHFGELRTKEVVVTEERMEHIRERLSSIFMRFFRKRCPDNGMGERHFCRSPVDCIWRVCPFPHFF